MASKVKPEQIKVILLGASGVGKSSLVHRYVYDSFNAAQDATIGAIFMQKIIMHNNRNIKFLIWDTAGQERFRALAKSYYQDAAAAILVYDITNKKSLERAREWYQEVINNSPQNVRFVLVGNKIDLVEFEEVDQDEARQFAQEIEALYIKTSAKANIQVDEVFTALAETAEPRKTTVFGGSFMLGEQDEPVEKPETKSKKCC